jgi:hypothetical protein
MTAAEIAAALADRIEQLVTELLPNGYHEGRQWRCGSLAGEPGSSLCVQLTDPKRGLWCDHATDQGGDALDLVKGIFEYETRDALTWARRWLGIEQGKVRRPPIPKIINKPDNPDHWRKPWKVARPIVGTLAETYLASRRLSFDDPEGRILRFHPCRFRNLDGCLQKHSALLAALCDIRTGEQAGIINVYLQPDGRDRLRDNKGKTVTGRAAGTAVMLSAFEEVTMGLVICEGLETGMAIMETDLRPVWACGGQTNVAGFPVLGGIECLTIAADNDLPGQTAAEKTAQRWRDAGREVLIVMPPQGDWADPT